MKRTAYLLTALGLLVLFIGCKKKKATPMPSAPALISTSLP